MKENPFAAGFALGIIVIILGIIITLLLYPELIYIFRTFRGILS